MRIKSVLLSLSVFLGLAAGSAHANLIVNGSFEQTTNGTNKQLAASTSAASGTTNRTTLVGWTSSNGTDGGYNFVLNGTTATTSSSALRLYGSNNGYTASPDGGNFFASDALYYPGTLSQTVNGLTIGTSYTLTFEYALGQQANYTGTNSNDYWEVALGSAVQDTSKLSIAAGGFSGWQTATMTFTATSVSEVLSFLAKTTSSGSPPFLLLDDVELNAVATSVPEPATLSLMLGGLGLLGVLARRRRRAGRA